MSTPVYIPNPGSGSIYLAPNATNPEVCNGPMLSRSCSAHYEQQLKQQEQLCSPSSCDSDESCRDTELVPESGQGEAAGSSGIIPPPMDFKNSHYPSQRTVRGSHAVMDYDQSTMRIMCPLTGEQLPANNRKEVGNGLWKSGAVHAIINT